MIIDNLNYKILLERTVTREDKVIFNFLDEKITYVIKETWLAAENRSETLILDLLRKEKIITESNYDFCKRTYGYNPTQCPEDRTQY